MMLIGGIFSIGLGIALMLFGSFNISAKIILGLVFILFGVFLLYRNYKVIKETKEIEINIKKNR